MPGAAITRIPPFAAALVSVVSIAMIAFALFRLTQADAGVAVDQTRLGPTPATVFRAADAPADAALPVVVIAHGFAGSQQLMQSFAVTLAKNGYLAVTFDYYGDGRVAGESPDHRRRAGGGC